jgi:hypothetical protein
VLAEQIGGLGTEHVGLVAVGAETREVIQEYLGRYGVTSNTALSLSPDDRIIRTPTPTVLVTNSRGEVEKSWIGLVHPERRQEIQEALGLPVTPIEEETVVIAPAGTENPKPGADRNGG